MAKSSATELESNDPWVKPFRIGVRSFEMVYAALYNRVFLSSSSAWESEVSRVCNGTPSPGVVKLDVTSRNRSTMLNPDAWSVAFA